MPDQHRKHDMNYFYAVISDFITNDGMPTGMPIMALATFANFDGGFDFKPYAHSTDRQFVDEVRIMLNVISPVSAFGIHCIRKNIRDEATEIVALDQVAERTTHLSQHVFVDDVKDGLGLVHGCFQINKRQPIGERHTRPEISRVYYGGLNFFDYLKRLVNDLLQGHFKGIYKFFQHLDAKVSPAMLD